MPNPTLESIPHFFNQNTIHAFCRFIWFATIFCYSVSLTLKYRTIPSSYTTPRADPICFYSKSLYLLASLSLCHLLPLLKYIQNFMFVTHWIDPNSSRAIIYKWYKNVNPPIKLPLVPSIRVHIVLTPLSLINSVPNLNMVIFQNDVMHIKLQFPHFRSFQ